MNKPGANKSTFILIETPKLNRMHPISHFLDKKKIIEAYNNSMAIGSLNSLRTNIECILCDVIVMITRAIGGTLKF